MSENEKNLEHIRQQALKLVQTIGPDNIHALRDYISLPNSPDSGAQVMGLKVKYGEKLSQVSDAVESLRLQLGVDYDTVKQAITDYLD